MSVVLGVAGPVGRYGWIVVTAVCRKCSANV